MYAGLSEENYKLIRNKFIKANERILLWLSFAMGCTMCIIGGLGLIAGDTSGVSRAYLATASVNIVVAIAIRIVGNRSLKLVQVLSYIFSVGLYTVTIFIEVYFLNTYPSVALIVFIVSLPLAFSARPIFTSGLAAAASVIYLVLAYFNKDYNIWLTDLNNIIAFGIIGLVLNLLLNKFKTGSLILEYQNNKIHTALEQRNREMQAMNVALKSGDWSIAFDDEGNVLDYEWSNESCRLLGYRDVDDMPKGLATWFDMIIPEEKDKVLAEFNAAVRDPAGRKNVDLEFRIRNKEGNYVWVRALARVIRDNAGKPLSLWGLIIDISKKKEDEINRMRQFAMVEALSRDYKDVFIINLSADRTIAVKINGTVVENFADHIHKYNGTWDKYVSKYVHPEDAERVLETFKEDNIRSELEKNGEVVCNYRIVVDSIIHHYQVTYFYIQGNELYDSFIVGGYRNIDDIVATEEEYNRNLQAAITEANETREVLSMVEIDDLTGTYTRQAFLKHAKDILDTNPYTSFDLLITDFEDFKLVNDQYGTVMGDELLKWFGGYLKETVGEFVLVGRYSGDQFAILIEHDILHGNAEIRNKISGNIQAPGLPMVMVKNGLYVNVNHDQAVTVLCDSAHMALNSIKHQYGQNYAIYDDEIKKQIEVKRRIERSMHKAVEEEQFKVYYQPKHNSVTDEIVGAEALIRWVHPEYGFMSPNEFIPLFEQNGFITEADCYVWNHTCDNIKRWINKGLKVVPVSVNASKIDFLHKDYLQRLDAAVDKAGIPKDLLHIEVTETLMAEEIESLAEMLGDFKGKGYKIELDDFGVGYSSLNILSMLPIDVVKLDMSFMRQFKDIKKSKILAACINLAKNLGLKTVSEGVETREQVEMLNDMGIDSVQGYYYSKPLPEEEFEAYLEKFTR